MAGVEKVKDPMGVDDLFTLCPSLVGNRANIAEGDDLVEPVDCQLSLLRKLVAQCRVSLPPSIGFPFPILAVLERYENLPVAWSAR